MCRACCAYQGLQTVLGILSGVRVFLSFSLAIDFIILINGFLYYENDDSEFNCRSTDCSLPGVLHPRMFWTRDVGPTKGTKRPV